jgi:hypothetical protein
MAIIIYAIWFKAIVLLFYRRNNNDIIVKRFNQQPGGSPEK